MIVQVWFVYNARVQANAPRETYFEMLHPWDARLLLYGSRTREAAVSVQQ